MERKQMVLETPEIIITRQVNPKIYAVDFDGVIVENAWPEIGAERPDIISYLKACRHNGHKLILWTCRTGELLTAAVEWCRLHGLAFDAVNENLPEMIRKYGGDTRKVHADFYIDDNSLRVMNIGQKWIMDE